MACERGNAVTVDRAGFFRVDARAAIPADLSGRLPLAVQYFLLTGELRLVVDTVGKTYLIGIRSCRARKYERTEKDAGAYSENNPEA